MSRRLTSFLRRNRGPLALLLLAGAVAVWLAFRMVADFLYFHDPAHRDVELRGWMTPRYVVETYDLPPSLVSELLDLPAQGPRRRRMRRIAADLGLTLEELTDRVRAAAAEYRQARDD
ncbi:hypothetical protein [Limimaricola litoreus]|uniref:Uncharacterized protein n=1 Tax=Limimaricola litoreus TaxID=2955316 RepID=A0A9X2FRX1_9RHOB|nr:hypothetical protein [Limimaricola litoreus]MCP1169090.1 hypothetical protein [Limimaricola litoreus]